MKVVRYSLSAACFAGVFCIALAAQTQSRRPAPARVPPAESKLVDVEGHKLSYKVAGVKVTFVNGTLVAHTNGGDVVARKN